MSVHPPETRRRAAELVGSGASYEEAARELGVAKRTVTRWMRDPAVRAIAAEERAESLDPTALGVVRGLLSSGNESIRLRAAALLIEKPDLEGQAVSASPTGPTVTVFGGSLDA